MTSLVYAIGDVHGRSDLLADLHDQIARDKAARGSRDVLIVYLGDYVDRGPDSKGALDLVRRGVSGAASIALMGNHEAALIDFLDRGDERSERAFLALGGDATVASFGAIGGGRIDRARLRAGIGEGRLAWLKALPSHAEIGGFFFVHAGVRPGVPLGTQRREDMLWIRHAFLDDRSDHGRRVVHGHTPTDEPVVRANRIGLDTGAVWSGRLTAARLDPAAPDAPPRFFTAIGPPLAV